MNYLAHAVLSGEDCQVMAGNLLADRIKGTPPTDLPAKVALGIRLHRLLDAHTDAHPLFKRSRSRIRSHFGHFSGIVIDVVYDHILARNMNRYTQWSLEEFVEIADEGYRECRSLIPNYLGANWSGLKWLGEYADEVGVARAFDRVNARAKRHIDFGEVMAVLRPHLDDISEDFSEFFPSAVKLQDDVLRNEL